MLQVQEGCWGAEPGARAASAPMAVTFSPWTPPQVRLVSVETGVPVPGGRSSLTPVPLESIGTL